MIAISIPQLQGILREVSQLSGVRIEQPFQDVAPNHVKLSGAISIHGKPFFWETEIDLNDLKRREDVATLIESLLTSFAKAEARGDQL